MRRTAATLALVLATTMVTAGATAAQSSALSRPRARRSCSRGRIDPAPRRHVRRQQLGGHRDRRRRPHPPADPHDRHHPRPGAADGRDRRQPRQARLLPRRPGRDRRGQRPVHRRHVHHPRRPAARRQPAELRRRRRHRPGLGRDRVALPDGGLPLRPHGRLPRRRAAAGQRLHGQQGARARHPHRREDRRVPQRRQPAREQLHRRRRAGVPRQHRPGLHADRPARRPPGLRHPEGRAVLPDRAHRRPADRVAGGTWARSWRRPATRAWRRPSGRWRWHPTSGSSTCRCPSSTAGSSSTPRPPTSTASAATRANRRSVP